MTKRKSSPQGMVSDKDPGECEPRAQSVRGVTGHTGNSGTCWAKDCSPRTPEPVESPPPHQEEERQSQTCRPPESGGSIHPAWPVQRKMWRSRAGKGKTMNRQKWKNHQTNECLPPAHHHERHCTQDSPKGASSTRNPTHANLLIWGR